MRMRTTIRLPDDLLASAKKLAAETRRTLTEVIEGALREVLARRGKARRRGPVKLTTVGGRGVQPGVDLDDGAALLDHMERRDDAP
jgi:hypothetical protein